MKNLFLLPCFLILSGMPAALAQTGTQTVKGRVLDLQSQYPLIGASVIVLNTEPLIGAATDGTGEFKLTDVPLGRQTLKITFMGYQERTLPNVLVTAGKEVVLTIDLEEQILTAGEVVVRAERDKAGTNNEFAVISARSFDVEETARYAGSRNDPARMAANFTGVSAPNDALNSIVIRGNSPTGLLWRLEGVNIPNPNHYGAIGTTGGPVNMLNNNVLSRSDFLTAAFPAQYGNALAGVFDLQMRSGNNEKREYLGQIGFNGFELGVEGPFSKDSRASYLANYRYSTLGVFNALGIEFGTGSAVPQYQDFSFKVDVPTGKAGRFTLFGLGGASKIAFMGDAVDTTSTTGQFYADENVNGYSNNRTGVAGLSHTYYFTPLLYSKITLAASTDWQQFTADSLSKGDRTPIRRESSEFTQNVYSLIVSLNKKFSARTNVSVGYIGDLYEYDLLSKQLIAGTLRPLWNKQGSSLLSQAFAQGQHRINERITLNGGLNLLHFSLNNAATLEPRAGVRYQLSPRQSINLGYGYHSQTQPLLTYFTETHLPDGRVVQTNRNLDFTRSQHAVIGYDRTLSENMRLRLEAYYQAIRRAPVESHPSSFSMLNAGGDFEIPGNDSLVNRGKGQNYGLELTLEKFYSKGYYFLLTGSLFDSKYRGSDGILRNTAFNGRYVVNALAGREITLGKRSTFTIDGKLTGSGGRYLTPIDFGRSAQEGRAIYRNHEAFSQQAQDYFRADVKVSYRMNLKRVTHEFAVDAQNITNRKNIFMQRYNPRLNQVVTEYQLGLFIIPQYRILF